MFCENCGLQFLPKQSVCDRCRVPPTRHWLQFTSLVILLVAVASNSLLAMFYLPRLAATDHSRLLFRAWLWLDLKAALYGWVILVLGLMAWDYFVWRGSRPKVRGWVTRKVLGFILAAGIAPMIPSWLPAGQPPERILAVMQSHPNISSLSAWAVAVLVLVLLCSSGETRDSLLGHGRALHVVSLGMLLLVLSMTMVGWSLAIH